jgi:GTP-binding protein YchF
MASRVAAIVGLPNVGKSTLFNALMGQTIAQAANFPFCTIEPNTAKLEVPDWRLAKIGEVSKSKRTLGWQLEVHDIAGLVPGASAGKGLGNAFLGHIRACDAILHCVRCHTADSEIIHTESRVDPVADIELIETELALADLQSVEKRLASKKTVKNQEQQEQLALLEAAFPLLQQGKPARALEASLTPKQKVVFKRLQLLTALPQVIVCNVDEPGAGSGHSALQAIKAKRPELTALPVCARLEAELALLAPEERKEVMSAYNMTKSGLDSVIEAAAGLLELQSFYTTGPQESRAWCITKGNTAQQAAGCIHSDIAAKLIKAEIVSYDHFLQYGGFDAARQAGVGRSEGRDYVMQEGDIALFRNS